MADSFLVEFDTADYAMSLARDMGEDRDTLTKTEHLARLCEMMEASEAGYEKGLSVIAKIKEHHKHRYKYKWIRNEMEDVLLKINKKYCNIVHDNNSLNLNNNNNNVNYDNNNNNIIYNENNNNCSTSESANSNYLSLLLKLLHCLLTRCPEASEKRILLSELSDLKIPEYLDLLSFPNSSTLAGIAELARGLKTEFEGVQDSGTLDLSDPVQVFYAVLCQVKGTPQYGYFQLCLQNFLRTDPTNALFDSVWEANASFTGKANVIETAKELPKLLREERRLLEMSKRNKSSECKLLACKCSCHAPSSCSTPDKTVFQPPPVPPPLPPLPPPIPNFPSLHLNSVSKKLPETHNDPPHHTRKLPEPPFNSTAHPFHTMPSSNAPQPPSVPTDPAANLFKLPIPIPSKKMKKLQWAKIAPGMVVGKSNLWTQTLSILNSDKHPLSNKVNFSELEMMFGRAEDFGSKVSVNEAEGRKKRSEEVVLLDSKRSLNINIFLHQVKVSYEQMLEALVSGREVMLSVEKLKGLMKILPESEELDLIKSYKGDVAKLGSAEKFYYELINYPTLKKSVQTHLMREEFQQLVDTLVPTLESFALSARDIKNNKLLPGLFELVLLTGNFMNAGGYAGEACAFKLASLLKLNDIKSNVQGVSLLHYIAETATRNSPETRELASQLKWLKETTQYSLESVTNDIKASKTKVEIIENNLCSLTRSMAEECNEFLETAHKALERLEREMEALKEASKDLAAYFCEDENSFKLDECLSIINSFVDAFDKAVKDNDKKSEKISRIEQSEVRLRRQGSLEMKSKGRLNNRKSENLAFLNQMDKDEFVDLIPSSKLKKRYSLAPSSFESSASLSSMSSDQDNASINTNVSSDSNTNSSAKLLDILNTSSISNGFNIDAGVRLRRKSKPPLPGGSKNFFHERERSTPEMSVPEDQNEIVFNKKEMNTNAFDRNHIHRRSMFEYKNFDVRRRSGSIEKNVKFSEDLILEDAKTHQCSESLPASALKFNSQYKSVDENTSTISKNERRKSSSGMHNDVPKLEGSTTLTEEAMKSHEMIEWKASNNNNKYNNMSNNNNFNNNTPFSDNRLKNKFSEYRNNEQMNRIHERKFPLNQPPPNSFEHNHMNSNTGLRNYEAVRGMYARDGRFENESVCSGTDEGFESMRNSVVSDDNNRTSPLHDTLNHSLNNTLTNNTENNCNNQHNSLKGSHDQQHSANNSEHSAITCSLDSLVQEKKLSLPLHDSDIRGATSVISVDLPKTLHHPNEEQRFLSYSDINAPNKSSTSTLKSSASGLHLENSNLSLDLRNSKLEEVFGENQLDQHEDIFQRSLPKHATSSKCHSQPPTDKQPLKEADKNLEEKLRSGSSSESGSCFDHKKKSVDVNELSSRLSQPKRQNLATNSYSTKQVLVVSTPPCRPLKPDRARTSSSESFRRGSFLRSTLPAKSAEKRRESSQPGKKITDSQNSSSTSSYNGQTHHKNEEIANNMTSVPFSNTPSVDLPPKPPARTTSISTRIEDEVPISNKKRSSRIELSSKLSSASPSFLNNTISTPKEARKTAEKHKPHLESKTPSGITSSSSLFKKMLSAKRQQSPPTATLDIKDTPKICRPTKPRTQTLTTYKR